MQSILFLDFTRPFADLPAGMIFAWMVFYGLCTIVSVTLIEAIALRLLKWGFFWESLLDSFLINLGSSVAGYTLVIGRPGIGIMFIADVVSHYFFLVFILTILIEGGILWLLRKRPLRKTASTAVIVNVVSYIGFTLLGLLQVWAAG